MKKSLLFPVLGLSMTSLIPLSFVVSCGSSSSLIGRTNNTFTPLPYEPFKVQVPNELFPGVKLDREKYDELEKAEQELNQPQVDSLGNYTFKTKNGFFTFQVQKELFGSDYFGSVENVKETIKNAIAQMAISPAIMMTFNNGYRFDLLGKVGAPITFTGSKPFITRNSLILIFSKSSEFGSEDGRIDNFKNAYSRVIAHEFNHGITWNSRLAKPGFAFEALQQIIKDTQIPLEYEKQLNYAHAIKNVRHNFSGKPEEWASISNESESIRLNAFINFVNGYSSVGYDEASAYNTAETNFFNEINDFIRGVYMTPVDYKTWFYRGATPIGDMMLILSYLTPNYNYFNIDDQLQSYNIMKAWAKYSLNMANGNNVELTYDASSQNNQIKEINFSSFGMAETNDISAIEIYDKSKNLTTPIYTQKVSHQDFPFGFNKNPFNDYEYKYVAPGAYSYDTSVKLNIAPQDIEAKIVFNDKPTENASSVYCAKTDITEWREGKWLLQNEKHTIF